MSPHFHFRLDRHGYEKCFDLLATAGMPFTEERRDSFPWLKGDPPITDIYGHLSSPQGAVPCRLRNSSGRSFCFTVTVLEEEHVEVLEEVGKVLADYLVREAQADP